MKDKEKQFKERINCGIAYCEDIPNNQIEEMAEVMCENNCEECRRESIEFYGNSYDEDTQCLFNVGAERLYEQGYRKIDKDSVVVSKEWWDKSITQKTFKFYKDENLSKELFLIPYSVCIRPSDDNMSLLSLYKTLVWCGYASENYWDWCENTKEAKEVSFYEYIDELVKAIQEQASKETAEKIMTIVGNIIDDGDDRFKYKDYQWHKDLCKQFGVGIKE